MREEPHSLRAAVLASRWSGEWLLGSTLPCTIMKFVYLAKGPSTGIERALVQLLLSASSPCPGKALPGSGVSWTGSLRLSASKTLPRNTFAEEYLMEGEIPEASRSARRGFELEEIKVILLHLCL